MLCICKNVKTFLFSLPILWLFLVTRFIVLYVINSTMQCYYLCCGDSVHFQKVNKKKIYFCVFSISPFPLYSFCVRIQISTWCHVTSSWKTTFHIYYVTGLLKGILEAFFFFFAKNMFIFIFVFICFYTLMSGPN